MLSEKMAKLRKSHRLKLREVSSAIGVTQSAVSMYESGERRPDYDTLMKIADLYNVTADYLLRDETNLLDDSDNKTKLLNEAYTRVMVKAKKSGIAPYDLEMALDFLVRAKRRDESVD